MSHLTHLRTFLEAYRARSFSRAAEHLGITQPAASMHVQALESLIGKPLFMRLARGVEPTDAAHELARAVAPGLDSLEAKLASLRSGAPRGGPVHLIGPADFIHCQLSARTAPLIAEGFTLRFQSGTRKRIYELLDGNAIDFAITASMPDEHAHGYAHLVSERMLLVYAPTLRDRLGDAPSALQLNETPLLAFDEDLPLVRPMWLARFQVAPSIQAAFTTPDLRTLKELAMAGHGWTVLPDYLCQDALANGRLYSATAPEEAATNTLYLVWNKRALKSPNLLHVRDFILAAFSQ